ncbi:hypothetical protein AKJ16_DCAP03740 [Drosera capensis]
MTGAALQHLLKLNAYLLCFMLQHRATWKNVLVKNHPRDVFHFDRVSEKLIGNAMSFGSLFEDENALISVLNSHIYGYVADMLSFMLQPDVLQRIEEKTVTVQNKKI